MATVAGIAVIRQFGLQQAFISLSPSTSHRLGDWLDSTWTLNVLFGLAVTGIAASAAYPASLFLEEGRLVSILLAISLLPTMVSLQSPGIMLVEKNAKFHGIATCPLSRF
jgi:PST family polysaccharide transporter/lipopolysaccharide exporter